MLDCNQSQPALTNPLNEVRSTMYYFTDFLYHATFKILKISLKLINPDFPDKLNSSSKLCATSEYQKILSLIQIPWRLLSTFF